MNTLKKLKTLLLGLAMTGTLAFSGTANSAALLGQEPDPNLLVSAGGMEWVYAGPCAPFGGCGDVLLHSGFVLPTASDWLASFANHAAIISAFTAPAGGAKCAATYFNTVHNHCDFGDATAGFIWGLPASYGFDSFHTEHPLAEAFLVRVGQVPEPGTLALLSIALLGFGVMRRKAR